MLTKLKMPHSLSCLEFSVAVDVRPGKSSRPLTMSSARIKFVINGLPFHRFYWYSYLHPTALLGGLDGRLGVGVDDPEHSGDAWSSYFQGSLPVSSASFVTYGTASQVVLTGPSP